MTDTDDPDPELAEAVESIPDADPDSLDQHADGTGSFMIRSSQDEQDTEEIDAELDGTGYERDGIMEGPEGVLQFYRPTEGGDE